MTRPGAVLDALDRDRLVFVRDALREWLPGAAQHVLDLANETITTDAEWTEDDDIATHAECLATVARVVAELGQILDHGAPT